MTTTGLVFRGEPVESFEARFWRKVKKDDDGCWRWTGHTDTGYGSFNLKGKSYAAHRLSLAMALGRELAPGMYACHGCRSKNCVNPAHLREGTHADNMADRQRDGTAARGAMHGRSKLTDEKVRAIRQDPRSHAALAKEYGVTAVAIGYIRRGKTWSHVVCTPPDLVQSENVIRDEESQGGPLPIHPPQS
jgi:hypothetical protein